MSLISFKVVDQKAIAHAEASVVPPVMVIAGPNGVGKSTLLYAIKNGSGQTTNNTRILYQGPNRVLRRTNVQRRWLGGVMKSLLELLSSGGEISGYEGLNFQNSNRTPDNVDEAGSTIKHTLGKIENRRQAVLAEIVDRHKKNGAGLDLMSLPDIYEPLQTLTKYLLPHLMFNKIDFTNEDNVQCLWSRTDQRRSVPLDIDDLSSGEKSIVILFLPLIEDQIRDQLKLLENIGKALDQAVTTVEDRVFLIDEPEQHLHPDLQTKILSYIRSVSRDAKVQFVVTTHSPSILDQAFDDELFMLSGPSATEGENQLRRIATDAERLEALKELAGSTYFLTTGRVIVCVEGERGFETDEPTDVRLLEMMYPRATAVTLVPTTGKGNVINTVTRLRDHVPENVFRIRVRGLVDADQSTEAVPGVEILPVCMIENFLLDPDILYAYCQSKGVTMFLDSAAISGELEAIAAELREDEITIRVRRRIKPQMIRLGGVSLEIIKKNHANALSTIQEMLPHDEELEKLIADVTAEVDRIIADREASQRFRGKVMLKRFYNRHISPLNIGYTSACLDLAKLIGKTDKVARRLDPVFDKLIA